VSRVRRAIVPVCLCAALGWIGWTSGRVATDDDTDHGGYCWFEVNEQMPSGTELICGTEQQEHEAEQSPYVTGK
jgi:hypothetical protein